MWGSSPHRARMTTTISIDFETRSTVDLRTRGVYTYAQHRDTDVWCMAWAIDDSDVQLWKMGEPFPEEIREVMRQGPFSFRAWNAQFERTIWRDIMVARYHFPKLALGEWWCTAAEGSAMGLPRALGDAAKVLKLEEQKDQELTTDGYKIALQMARPRRMVDGVPVWWDVPEKIERLHRYCMQDVRTERAVAKIVRRLGPSERRVYLADQRINDKGCLVDVPLAIAAEKITHEGLARANREINELTGGAVSAVTQVANLTGWLKAQGVQDPNDKTDAGAAAELSGITKDTVRDLLEGELPSTARRALELRAEAGRSSVTKINTMLTARGSDDRVKGMFLYHGAGTGRWSVKLVQLHNFPRPDDKVHNPKKGRFVESFIPDILEGKFDLIDMFHPPLMVIASLLRGMIRAAPGHKLVVFDFEQIEARVLAWMAGQADLIQLFANKGKVYETFAANLYKVPVESIAKDDPRRQFGKNMVLGCGYGMGADTYQANAKVQMGVEITEEFAKETITAYRTLVPMIVQFWKDLNNAATWAVKEPGKITTVRDGLIKFVVRGNWLWMMLPSNRPLAYHRPSIRPRMTPWGEMKDSVMVWGTNSVTKQWTPYALYGGILAENAVQAASRDLLANGIIQTQDAGYDVILHAHDELVAEVPDTDTQAFPKIERCMTALPAWAKGCPVTVEGYEALRYRK